MIEPNCVFCQKSDILMENADAKAFYDLHPMAKGHLLIVPKVHYQTFFDVPRQVQQQMVDLLDQCKELLDQSNHPRGYQVFSHIGSVAGQRVDHAHIHLVPVY